jgi:ceramide glucosyltransferase
MGRQDCLGATMALRRNTLAQIGGLQALVDHLADDQVLGRRVAALGLAVRLAGTVVATTVPETRWRDLWRHELRWARTIRALEPGPYAASILQYPLFWATLTVLLAGGALWSIGMFLVCWAGRALAAVWIDRMLEPFLTPKRPFGRPPLPGWRGGAALRPHDLRLEDGGNLAEAVRGVAFPCPVWLLPLRDIISVGVMLASYAGRRVDWRGHQQIADPGRVPPGPNPSKGLRPR